MHRVTVDARAALFSAEQCCWCMQVYQGGGHKEKLASDIETALTRRDEFGRVMTPKEAFRALCHKCASELKHACC